MIYAIEAVGTDYIKFGRAKSVGQRLVKLEGACPHELHILATADWPDGAETAIHRLLEAQNVRGEWYKASARALDIIKWMQNRDVGLARLHTEVRKLGGRPDWLEVGRKRSAPSLSIARAQEGPARVSAEPELDLEAWWRAREARKSLQRGDTEKPNQISGAISPTPL